MMNRQTAIVVVTVLGLLSLWGLTRFSPPTDNVEAASYQSGAQTVASSGSPSAANASPDLTMTDAQAFLDPIPVGRKVPDFTLMNATTGKPFKLSQHKGKHNLVLVFYQGSFCPVCGHQLENLQRHLADFAKQDAEIVAISADDLPSARRTVGEHGLSFHVLADPEHKVIKLFGVANLSKRGIAWPSSFVLDKQGQVRLSMADPQGKRLHSNGLLPVLSQITGKPVPKLTYDE
jgi:peroxiredoxin